MSERAICYGCDRPIERSSGGSYWYHRSGSPGCDPKPHPPAEVGEEGSTLRHAADVVHDRMLCGILAQRETHGNYDDAVRIADAAIRRLVAAARE